MSQPILAKENKQLLLQLEKEITNLLYRFESDTGLCVRNIDVKVIEYSSGVRFNEVRIDNLSISESIL